MVFMEDVQNPMSLSLEDLTNPDKVRAFDVLAFIDKHGLLEARRNPQIKPELDYCLKQGLISEVAIKRAEGMYQRMQEKGWQTMANTSDKRTTYTIYKS